MAVKNEWSLDDGRITFGAPAGAAGRQRDPVCGMDVPGDADQTASYGGKEYRFCSRSCRDSFLDNPERYVGPAGEADKEDGSR